MAMPGRYANILGSMKKTPLLLVAVVVSMLLFYFSTVTLHIHADSIGLENLPVPFASNGSLNCSVVVASSTGHGPCGGANTMDVMGAIMVSAQFGLKTDNGTLEATMDDYISSYDFSTAEVRLNDVSSNLVVVGGPGVNQVTWYYNNLRNSTGSRVLPAYFDKEANGTDCIRVASNGHSYRIEHDGQGRIKTDYGIVLIFQDGGRSVLVLAGLGGSGTWASCKIVSSFEAWNLRGNAVVVKYNDGNGDGLLDSLSIVEEVLGAQQLSLGSNPIMFGMLWTVLLPKARFVKRIVSKRQLLKASLFLLLLVAPLVFLSASSGLVDPEIYTFKDFTQPFVSAGGPLNCTAVVASSVGHGPCGGAHTMDVMGAITVAAQLGQDASGGALSSTLDDYISSYDYSNARVSFSTPDSNLVIVGGPGVNQVTWYYNNLRNSTGSRVLPAYFDKEANGTDCIRVASNGHSYRIEHDGQGRIKTDYGIVILHHDSDHGMWVLIAAGLGGSGTTAVTRLLSNYTNWSLFGQASVIKYRDSNGDGYLDEISIAESVGFGKSIDVYANAECQSSVKSIDWGTLSPAEAKKMTIYVRNEGESPSILTMNVYGWVPSQASNYLRIEWNYTGVAVEPGQTVAIVLTLTVDSKISGIADFGVDITVDSS